MKYAIISGSTRQNNPQSLKVARYIKNYLEGKSSEGIYLLDLSSTTIKYWDESFWTDYNNFDSVWTSVSQELHSSDGIIIVAPEWNGMLPPALKNIFHLSVKREFANKPALIISISSSINGVYPTTELRLNTYKNTFINYIPEQIIIRNVSNVLNNLMVAESTEDRLIRERIDYTLQILKVYTRAFITIRDNDIIKNNPYPYGM